MTGPQTARRAGWGAAIGLALLLVGCGVSQPEPTVSTGLSASASRIESTSATPESRPWRERRSVTRPRPDEPAAPVAPLPQGAPANVRIPALGVDAALVPLGLEADGSMQMPDFGLAGWYAEGPRPGHPGPAVVAAHVDSWAGPDVFYRLRELSPGDEVVVSYDTGDEAVFEVVSSERLPKEELPGDRIWPVTADPLLTLITCGGDFDRSIRSYRDNVIVYTRPAG
jgi:hypothetical protein